MQIVTMWPNPADRKGYQYPQDSLLQIHGSVPEDDMRKP